MSLETKDVAAWVKKRPLLTTCALLVAALGLALYFRLDVQTTLETQLAEREKELSRLTNNVKFSAQLDTQLEALRQANARIADGALREADRARNQQVFYRLESDSGVQLVDIRQLAIPAPARGGQAPKTFVSIPFNVTIRGDYEQIIGFLNRLDHGATLSRVSSAGVARPEGGQHTLSFTVDMLGLRQ